MKKKRVNLFDRKLLKKKYGISFPKSQQTKRSVGRNYSKGKKKLGNLHQKSQNLVGKNNFNKANPNINVSVTHEDFSKGIHSLIQKGIIPQHSDLTSMLSTYPSPVTTAKVPLHTVEEKHFVKPPILTSDMNHMFQNVKYDLVSFERAKSVERNRLSRSRKKKPKKAKKRTLNVSMFPNVKREAEFESRKYTDLMDKFSSHHLIIRRGKIIVDTEEFISFQRTYRGSWGPIVTILKELERLMMKYDISIAFVDGKKVVKLSEITLNVPKEDDLFECIVNYDEVISQIKRPEKRFEGSRGRENAAIVIQKFWKMYIAKKRFKVMLRRDKSAKKIQKQWVLRKNFFQTKKRIDENLEKLQKLWYEKMETFKKDWVKIGRKSKLVIHLPSISGTEEQRKTCSVFKLRENSQFARILQLLKDPKLQLLYISPFRDNEEAFNELITFVEKFSKKKLNIENRVKIIAPEHIEDFPSHFSLTRHLLYSPRTMKYISIKSAGRSCYIIPGKVGKEELRLSMKLQIPLLGAHPIKSIPFGEKSGIRKIFTLAKVNIPKGEHDIFEETDIILHLSKKIMEFPHFETWIIKINNEFNSRGIAYLNVNKINCLKKRARDELLKELQSRGMESELNDHTRDQIYFELRDDFGKKVTIVKKHVYKNWKEFLKKIKKFGCVIEAFPNNIIGCPVANMFIEPNGTVNLTSIQDQIIYNNFTCVAYAFPQVEVPKVVIDPATKSVGRILFQKGVLGYVSVEYVAFMSLKSQIKLWGIDIKFGLKNHSLIHSQFDFLDKKKDVRLCYLYSKLLHHKALTQWRHENFVDKLKQKGLYYNPKKNTGIVMQVMANVIKGAIGALCVAPTDRKTIVLLHEFLGVIEGIKENKNPKESNLFQLRAVLKNMILGSCK